MTELVLKLGVVKWLLEFNNTLAKSFVAGKQTDEWEGLNYYGTKSQIEVNGKIYSLEIYTCRKSPNITDTIPPFKLSGVYPDVIILAFPVVEVPLHRGWFLNSQAYYPKFIGQLWNSAKRWKKRLNKLYKNTPVILVGSKTHLRSDPASLQNLLKQEIDPVSAVLGHKIAREVDAVKYLECSCESMRGVYNVFYEAIVAAIGANQDRENQINCKIF